MQKEPDLQKRKEAIEAILRGEISQNRVAKEFGVSRQAVSLWIKRYQHTGKIAGSRERKDALRSKVNYITQEEQDKMVELIRTTVPQDHGLRSRNGKWALFEVNELCKKEFGHHCLVDYCIDVLEAVARESGPWDQHLDLSGMPVRRQGKQGPPPVKKSRKKRGTAIEVMTDEELSYYEQKIEEARASMKAQGVNYDPYAAYGGRKKGKPATPSRKKAKAKRKQQRAARKKSRK
jgi:transposase